MAIFFVKFKRLDPVREKHYFGNFRMPYETVEQALVALQKHKHVAAIRIYAVPSPKDSTVMTIQREKERSLSLEDISVVSLTRFTFEHPRKN